MAKEDVLLLNLLLGAIVVVTGLVWLLMAIANGCIFVRRCAGYGSISGLPAIGMLAGFPAAIILVGWFRVRNPALIFLPLIPDLLLLLGDHMVMWFREKVLGLPDKSLPAALQQSESQSHRAKSGSADDRTGGENSSKA